MGKNKSSLPDRDIRSYKKRKFTIESRDDHHMKDPSQNYDRRPMFK